jgi:Mpv17 / PMP22 family
MMGGMDGMNTKELYNKWQRDWRIYMAADFSFWPFFQFFNFRFIELRYQTFGIYVATLLFTVVMSAIESRDVDQVTNSQIKDNIVDS